jgi:fermentation-respiration switch protein FrsA (DUF1100 family)
MSAVRYLPRLLVSLLRWGRSRPTQPRTIVVLPGRSVGDASTAPLRWALARRGHRVRPWGLGTNDGDVVRLLPAVERLLDRCAAAEGGRIVVVGQSLGGYLAREAVRTRPEVADLIVTLGTPLLRPRSLAPLGVPVVALYSRADTIVPPAHAMDSDPSTRMVEITSRHTAMGLDPRAIQVVIDAVEGRADEKDAADRPARRPGASS